MKNKILTATSLFMLAVMVLGACGLDAPNKTIPLIMCGIPTVWFTFFSVANRERKMG